MRRPLVASAVLLAVYLALSLFNDSRGYLGTDTGAKVATLEMMSSGGGLDPDVGYWAERWDPEGRVHPLYATRRVGERWVNVTTLPMLYAAYPLYRLGGYRLALLLPMLGSVLAALAARALARRLGGGDGWGAFWVVGLASPLAIYALDFWEHSLGVAAMAWAIVLLVDVVDGRRPWFAGGAAGLLFGVAATMRTEALAYGLVAVGGAGLTLLAVRRRLVAAVGAGLAAAGALALVLLANNALERATLGAPIRLGRASGTASSAVYTAGAAAGKRIDEALLTAVALTPREEAVSYVAGLALALLLAFVVVRGARRTFEPGPVAVALAGAGLLYLLRAADGPGFVPGLLAATPLAVAGMVRGWWSGTSRYLVAVAVLALPIVWATQFLGGAAPQWAGRYTLASGLVLGVVGLVVLGGLERWVRVALLGLAGGLTLFGLVWMGIRTHDIGRAGARLASRPEPVLVSREGHVVREVGVFYTTRRWLTAPSDEDQEFAVSVLERAGVDRFALVQLAIDGRRPPVSGWKAVGRDRFELVDGFDVDVTSYEREPREGVSSRP